MSYKASSARQARQIRPGAHAARRSPSAPAGRLNTAPPSPPTPPAWRAMPPVAGTVQAQACRQARSVRGGCVLGQTAAGLGIVPPSRATGRPGQERSRRSRDQRGRPAAGDRHRRRCRQGRGAPADLRGLPAAAAGGRAALKSASIHDSTLTPLKVVAQRAVPPAPARHRSGSQHLGEWRTCRAGARAPHPAHPFALGTVSACPACTPDRSRGPPAAASP
jgi:hypothetical protein